jgi:hypothetical protein
MDGKDSKDSKDGKDRPSGLSTKTKLILHTEPFRMLRPWRAIYGPGRRAMISHARLRSDLGRHFTIWFSA